jgi:hypothetical protein
MGAPFHSLKVKGHYKCCVAKNPKPNLRQKIIIYPPNLSIWKEASLNWISPFQLLTQRMSDQAFKKVSPGLMLGRLKWRYLNDT